MQQMSSVKATVLIPGFTDLGQGSSMPDHLRSRFSIQHADVQLPWQATLCQLLGWNKQTGDRLPCLTMESKAVSMVYADPVHLRADRDSATLLPPHLLDLDESTADTLIAALNGFVESDGLLFHRRAPYEWFLTGMDAQSLVAYPTSYLSHRKASAFLPVDAAEDWRRLMTEIQMLLHAHPLNQERERQGLLTVNSVWFWGGAPLSDIPAVPHNLPVYADDPYAVSLCQQQGIICHALSQLTAIDSPLRAADRLKQNIVIVDTRLINASPGSEQAEYDELTRTVCESYLAPLTDLVLRGRLDELHLQSEDGLQWVCKGSMSWWRRLIGQGR